MRRLVDVLLKFALLCAGIGSPIAIMVLLLAPHFGWWGATLEKYPWLFVVLVLIFSSRWVVGGWLYYQAGKHLKFLRSPEGQRQKAQEIQETTAAIFLQIMWRRHMRHESEAATKAVGVPYPKRLLQIERRSRCVGASRVG